MRQTTGASVWVDRVHCGLVDLMTRVVSLSKRHPSPLVSFIEVISQRSDRCVVMRENGFGKWSVYSPRDPEPQPTVGGNEQDLSAVDDSALLAPKPVGVRERNSQSWKLT